MFYRTISFVLLLSIAWFTLSASPVSAQLTVQQPVFSVNGVTTTVSVPDRGRAHLGSIGRARDSRTSFGPFRSGSNIGLDREHSGISVGVTIHDFEAMDEYLLSQAAPSSPSANVPLTGHAGHAWRQLQAQHGGRIAETQTPKPILKSEKYWRLGQDAEKEGKPSVARLHYRIASKYGSESATARLAELDSPKTSSQVAARER